MELARFENILAIKTGDGKVVGFHAHNLQVAKLDEVAWTALQTPAVADPEAVSEIESWNRERDPQSSDSNIRQEIRSLTINIAQVCNLKCNYCAAGGDGSYGDPMKEIDLSALYEQISMLLHDVRPGERFKFTFLGGEPLVAPEAIKAIHRFVKLQVAGRNIRVRYDMVTNGTLITPGIAEMLANMQCHVTVSLDGPPEVNDRNRPTRGGLGSTNRTLKGIAHLRAVQDRLGSLNAGAVFGSHHLGVLETYKFLQPLGFDSFKFDFAAAKDDDKDSDAYVEGIAQVADYAWKIGGEAELRKINLFEAAFATLDAQNRIHNHCGAGKSHLQVDTRGRFYVCQWFVNDASEEVGRGSLIEHKKLEEYADPLTEKHGCGSCWARHLCGGGCMFVHKMKSGSKHTKDNSFCTRTRSILAKGIEYYAEARYQSTEGDRRETH